MKVRIDVDEWYPVYSVHERWGTEAELTDDEHAQVVAAIQAFDAAQSILRQALCRAKGHEWHRHGPALDESQQWVRCAVCGVKAPDDVAVTVGWDRLTGVEQRRAH